MYEEVRTSIRIIGGETEHFIVIDLKILSVGTEFIAIVLTDC